LAGLAWLHAQLGERAAALELVIQILQHPCADREAKGSAERLLAELEPQMTPQEAKAANARAQLRSFDTLVAELLDFPRESTSRSPADWSTYRPAQ
jgi:hypothetical protein